MHNYAQNLRDVSARMPTRAHDDSIDSLSVMPLVNVSGELRLDYLTDGITESIINTIAQLPKLRVTAWSTVFRLKGRTLDPIAAGRKLGVRAVLTGHILQLDDQIIVRTELIDTTDGAQLGGAQYSRRITGGGEPETQPRRAETFPEPSQRG